MVEQSIADIFCLEGGGKQTAYIYERGALQQPEPDEPVMYMYI